MRRLMLCLVIYLLCIVYVTTPIYAQTTNKPFSLPFNTPPGLQTWLLGQHYGNTTGAYNYGKYWYRAGQGMHFGIDFAAPCGTVVTAIADGVVDHVDNFTFGLEPHNIMLKHPDSGYTSVYGHLLKRSALHNGDIVKRGDPIGLTGDPDRTCLSRPHLHFEIRTHDYNTYLNPVNLIDADWSMLSTIGYYTYGGFVKDLANPRQWQTPDMQPEIQVEGSFLNRYQAIWPPPIRIQPPPQTLPAMTAPDITEGKLAAFTDLTDPGCCSQPFWSVDSRQVLYLDGETEHETSVMAIDVEKGGTPDIADEPPPASYSTDGTYRLKWQSGTTTIERLTDNSTFTMNSGSWPAFSPNTKWILWQYLPSDPVPGSSMPVSEIWLAQPDGRNMNMIMHPRGGSVFWLDDDRILIQIRKDGTDHTSLQIYTISTDTTVDLFDSKNLRGLSVAPSGKYIMFYTPFQELSDSSAIYLMETKTGAIPTKLPFFGSWRWRDSTSVIYIPFAPDEPMKFVYYDVLTGKSQELTDPVEQRFSVVNDDWAVSPDGRYIVMWQKTTATSEPRLTLVTLP